MVCLQAKVMSTCTHFQSGMLPYGHVWIIGMDLWADLAHALIRLKPHKQRYFNRGFEALSLMQPILQNVVTL